MITLFRRIRQKLIGSGSFTKYLLYAIGEILLVVIGILIALQVSNWNDQQNKIQQEKVILQEIISDLEQSGEAIHFQLLPDTLSVVEYIRSMTILSSHIKQDLAYHDSLDIHFTNLFTYEPIVYKISGYETLKSYGFDYIRDPDLRKEIGIYFTTVVPQTRQSFEEVRDDFYSYMIDYLRKDFETVFNYKSNESRNYYIPLNYQELAADNEFVQSINIYRDIQEQYVRNLKTSSDETQQLQNLIRVYLQG